MSAKKSLPATGPCRTPITTKRCAAGATTTAAASQLQLCVLRQYGRFLDRYGDVPVRILNHLNRQLGLRPTVSLPEAERDATESSHQQRIREYLGYRTFDDVVFR
jgi:Domain of unknown function (DUF4158)